MLRGQSKNCRFCRQYVPLATSPERRCAKKHGLRFQDIDGQQVRLGDVVYIHANESGFFNAQDYVRWMEFCLSCPLEFWNFYPVEEDGK